MGKWLQGQTIRPRRLHFFLHTSHKSKLWWRLQRSKIKLNSWLRWWCLMPLCSPVGIIIFRASISVFFYSTVHWQKSHKCLYIYILIKFESSQPVFHAQTHWNGLSRWLPESEMYQFLSQSWVHELRTLRLKWWLVTGDNPLVPSQ